MEAAKTMRVSELMTPDPVTVTADASLDEAIRVMDAKQIRHLPVTEDGLLLGVVSDRELLAETGWLHTGRVSSGTRRSARPVVREIMNEGAVPTRPDEDLASAASVLLARRIGCLPVVESGVLVGILTEMDLLDAYARACDEGAVNGDGKPTVDALMTREPAWLREDATLDEAAGLFQAIGVRHLPVVRDGRLVGIVSDRDLRKASGRGLAGGAPVSDVMTREVVSLLPEASASTAAEKMSDEGVSALPVVSDEGFVGILTTTDLLRLCERVLVGAG
jgi:CBS domain-containing protein